MTPETLKQLGIVDEIIPEPLGGAHRDYAAMMATLKPRLSAQLDKLAQVPLDKLIDARYQRLMSYGNTASSAA